MFLIAVVLDFCYWAFQITVLAQKKVNLQLPYQII